MPSFNTVSWQNAQFIITTEQLNNAKNNLQLETNTISSLNESIGQYQQSINFFDFCENNISKIAQCIGLEKPLDAKTEEVIFSAFQAIRNQNQRSLTDLEHSAAETNSKIAHYRYEIARLTEQLNRLPSGTKTLTTDTLKKALAIFKDKINPRQILLCKNNSNSPFIRLVIKNVKYTLIDEEERYPFILTPHPQISIPLPPMEVHIFLENGKVSITPYKNAYTPYMWDGKKTVHPHIIAENSPCLGDFSASFREALDNEDWVLAISIFILFLETVNSSDIAGAQWGKYFFIVHNAMQLNLDLTNVRVPNTAHARSNRLFKIRELEQPGTFMYEAYTTDGSIRTPEDDFPHPWNSLF